jgi:hypothetical protein
MEYVEREETFLDEEMLASSIGGGVGKSDGGQRRWRNSPDRTSRMKNRSRRRRRHRPYPDNTGLYSPTHRPENNQGDSG